MQIQIRAWSHQRKMKHFPWVPMHSTRSLLSHDAIFLTSFSIFQAFDTKNKVKSKKWMIDQCEEKAAAHPSRTFMHFQDKTFTYGFVNQKANKVANWAETEGWKCQDVVALFLHNDPSYAWICPGTFRNLLNTI